jgi:hypothetical protein
MNEDKIGLSSYTNLKVTPTVHISHNLLGNDVSLSHRFAIAIYLPYSIIFGEMCLKKQQKERDN